MMDISGTMTYGFYATMSILSGIFVWKFIPETKGKTLEELESIWEKDKPNENKQTEEYGNVPYENTVTK